MCCTQKKNSLFAKSQDLLDDLVSESLKEHCAGKTQTLKCDDE